MKGYVARAMQVACLEHHEVAVLHEIENRRGDFLANWNIQEILNKPPIKVLHNIPHDAEKQVQHAARIEAELKRLSLIKIEGNLQGLEWMHAFDNTVMENKGGIVWEYSGSGPRSSGGGGLAGRLRQKDSPPPQPFERPRADLDN